MHKMPNLEADWLQQQQRGRTGRHPCQPTGQECEAPFFSSAHQNNRRLGKASQHGFVIQSSDGRVRIWRGSILPSMNASECCCRCVYGIFSWCTLNPLAPGECLNPFMGSILSSDGNFLSDAVVSTWTKISLECFQPGRVQAVSAGAQCPMQYFKVCSLTVTSGRWT